MAIVGKKLSSGQVSDTQAAIYTAPADKTARVKSIIFNNTSANEETVTLYGNAGSARVLGYQVMLPGSTWIYQREHPIMLDDGDTLEAVCSTDAVVNYWISGGESDTPTTGAVPKHIVDDTGSGGSSTVYTVPTGMTFYLGHVIAYSSTGGVGTEARIYAKLISGADECMLFDFKFMANEYFVFETPLIMNDADELEIYADLLTDYWVDGIEEIL